jgi:hypothetical protein
MSAWTAQRVKSPQGVVTQKDTPAAASRGAEIPCPKCHQRAADAREPADGVLEFRCNACGHQWWLFDRSPQEDSER